MALYVGVYSCEVGLVDHGEFKFLPLRRGEGLGGKVEVEGALEDGGVGDGGDGVEGEEVKGLFEGPDYACGEEEEEAWRKCG